MPLGMERFFWVCFAGAVGTGVRYLVGLWTTKRWGAEFPYATLVVNVTGCFLAALLVQATLGVSWISPTLRLTLMVGFLGGLTTYSSFNQETTSLFVDGATTAAVANLAANLVGGGLAGVAGLVLGRRLFGA
jgi:CrcB protein